MTHELPLAITPDDIRKVSPALEALTTQLLRDELWTRPGLRPRDRSIVTVSALIARGQTVGLSEQIERALGNGVEPREVSEIITHLAFYAGWSSALAAVPVAAAIFAARGVQAGDLPPASGDLLPLDPASEAARAAAVDANFGATAPGVVHYTTEALFRNLWLRPALAPRDRSLVTVSALVANAQVAQIPFHLNRAMDNGLKSSEAAEALTQLAFHAGWPCVFSALPVFKDVFSGRSQ